MHAMFTKSFRVRIAVVAIGSVLSGGAALQAESVLIQRKYDPSRPMFSEMKIDTVQKISAPGMPGGGMEIKVSQLYCLKEKVKEGDGGRKIVTLTFDRAMQSMDMPMMGSAEFDSDDPDDPDGAPMLGVIYKNLVGESLTVEIDKEGKVAGFSGMDAIASKISEKASVNQFWMMMKSYFTDERGRGSYAEDPLRFYPNRSVKVGDTWESESTDEMPQVGKTQTKHQFKLEKLATEDGRKVAYITYTTRESLIPSEGEENEAGGKKSVEGSSNGTAIYDIERGLIVRNTGEEKKKVVMPGQSMGGGASEVTIEVKSKFISKVFGEEERTRQKEVTARKIAERKKAEEEEDEDEEDDDEDDDE